MDTALNDWNPPFGFHVHVSRQPTDSSLRFALYRVCNSGQFGCVKPRMWRVEFGVRIRAEKRAGAPARHANSGLSQ